jgi:hypothetical protein
MPDNDRPRPAEPTYASARRKGAIMATKSRARAAAWTAAAILTVTAGLEVYWGLGGTWALHESPGGAPVST